MNFSPMYLVPMCDRREVSSELNARCEQPHKAVVSSTLEHNLFSNYILDIQSLENERRNMVMVFCNASLRISLRTI